jgi:ABC-2 type transport system ATP-binding protein
MIEVEGLGKRYDNKAAISDVTFNVDEGEVLGFLGPNGAGKTTTMRAITGFLPATEGHVRVAGYDVFEQPLEVRRRVGYLPETPPLYPEMTVAGYLRFVAKIKGVAWTSLDLEVDRVMDKVHVDAVADRIIGRLSKGYRQRVGLAQALLNDPPVLILDEPTVGLDPKQIHEVRELIREWKGKHTVILSTHILPEVEQTCSRVVIIDKGRIVAVDSPTNLVNQLKGADRVVVELDAGSGDVVAALSGIAGVFVVRAEGRVPGGMRFEIETGDSETPVQPRIAKAIVERGWSLFAMQSSTMSLEDIFLKLTTDDTVADPRTDAGGGVPDSSDSDTEPGAADPSAEDPPGAAVGDDAGGPRP